MYRKSYQGVTHLVRCTAVVSKVRQDHLPTLHGEVVYTDGVAAYMFTSNGYHLVTLPAETALNTMVSVIADMVRSRGFMVDGYCESHEKSSLLANGQLQCDKCGEVY